MRPGAVAAALLIFLTTTAEAADPAFDRAVDAAKASAVVPGDIIETASAACDTPLCFAQALAAKLPGRVRLEPVDHPDTDSIRWARTDRSVIAEETLDTLRVKITHFGRKAVQELREALSGAKGRLPIELDLRGNPGGDFERMLQIAGLLLGSRRDMVEIDHGDHVERRSLPGPTTRNRQVVSVEIDEETASAALLLARLLAAHGDTETRGSPLFDDPVFLKRRITIDHDWRLVLPIAEVRVAVP
ncbi:MAG: S41 family peptidase [Geminicoccaceae bacterium]